MIEVANLDDVTSTNVLITFVGSSTKKLVGEAAHHFIQAFMSFATGH
jgi:hypothetical protein